jgi:hypothetical protein
MQSYFRERIWSKMFIVRKIKTKKYSFCLPSENLFQILPESGSGSALDPDRHYSKMLNPDPYLDPHRDPHITKADLKHF